MKKEGRAEYVQDRDIKMERKNKTGDALRNRVLKRGRWGVASSKTNWEGSEMQRKEGPKMTNVLSPSE